MTVTNLRPVGWDGVTPRQWGTYRAMVGKVYDVAVANSSYGLALRAIVFLDNTEGRDV